MRYRTGDRAWWCGPWSADGAVGAAAVGAEGDALGAHLQALRNGFQAELERDRAAIPFHERGADLENLVAIHADDLRDLGAGALDGGPVKLLAGADVHLAQDLAFGHQG